MWAFIDIGFAGGVVAIIVFAWWFVKDRKEHSVPADMRESRRKYDRAEQKARCRSFWRGTDYDTERKAAMREAFPTEEIE